MGLSSLCLVLFLCLFLKLIQLEIVVSKSFTSFQPSCHDDERSALLQFKESFVIINKSASLCDPKVFLQWKSEGVNASNCCSWDGVQCDEETGNVIGLDLSSSCLFGSIDSNSTLFNLVRLQSLNLAYNDFNYSQIPVAVGKLLGLTYLNLSGSVFWGQIPCSLQNLTHLTTLSLYSNQITGPIPLWLGNLTNLKSLVFSNNQLHGLVPQSLSNLMNLETLRLNTNKLNGTLKFDMFFSMKSLAYLELSENNLSLLFTKGNKNATSSKFKHLGLKSCNLREFPYFIRHQNELEWLSLTNNQICCEIPKWMWNTSLDTLAGFSISDNFLIGFLPVLLPWVNLRSFCVSFNRFRGTLPIPPPSIIYYNVSNNLLTGEVSNMFCNLSSPNCLDLSDNTLDGKIPQCLGNLSSSLYVLNLRNNFFHGTIPEICSNNNASNLRIIDLSYNTLQGQLPRTLSNCKMLEGIVVSNNQLSDVFPSWLGSLPVLKLLILQHNGFYGVIEKPKNHIEFPKLQVIDISFNNFTGELPSHYISSWNAMKAIDPDPFTYLSVMLYVSISDTDYLFGETRYAITITTKGVNRYYGAIQGFFASIDMSSNKFEGEISKLFGNLKSLHSLNLSNNMLTGCIPSSFGNLTELESLDLSQNNLSGEIPQQLKQLGFLESFNVSHNKLTGPIPQGNQFSTFESSSFKGNPGLCGDPLFKKCGDLESLSLPPSVFEENDDSESLFKLDWKFVLIGYISGLVVGVVLCDFVVIRRHGWWVKMQRKRRRRRSYPRN